ncbi:type VI secretion system protein [Desulfuromonas soudanensis]|uniref:Type VI secretion system protein n=1 Tax=Desulfuromonas soudanensis TaxID=1603606 RepID=A0A0M4CZ91_9BACT|nr:type VI secretion system-associated protein TagF [Desulfuromonas soudanensis]ALC17978.1 type VI secretion system protein [Desulfuromonas soudanensis]
MFGLFSKAIKHQPRAVAGDQLGCFGKMPIHSEFIRHNVKSREAVALDAWIQEGIGFIIRKHGSSWPETYRTFPGCHFVMVGGEEERTVIGTLIPSQDRSGRHYPFILFTVAEDPIFRRMQAVPPAVYDEFFLKAQELCEERWKNEGVPLLVSRVEGLYRRQGELSRRLLLEQQIEILKNVELGLLWRTALPDLAPENRQMLFATLVQTLRTVTRRTPLRTSWGVRLPLPGEGNPRPFVIFWMQLIESILEDRNLRAHYFWRASSCAAPASLTVFFRPIPGSYLLHLIDPALNDGSIFDVVAEMSRGEGKENLDLRRLLADDRVSLLDVLYRLGRREVAG